MEVKIKIIHIFDHSATNNLKALNNVAEVLAKAHQVFTKLFWFKPVWIRELSSDQLNVNSEDHAFLATIVKVNLLPLDDAEARYIYSS